MASEIFFSVNASDSMSTFVYNGKIGLTAHYRDICVSIFLIFNNFMYSMPLMVGQQMLKFIRSGGRLQSDSWLPSFRSQGCVSSVRND